jgi:ABC-type lipoprotein export system ATPase subunit
MAEQILNIDDVTVGVKGRTLIEHINLNVASGQSVAIMGPTGCGKTTLLACILGMRKPQKGSIAVAGQTINEMRSGRLARFRAQTIGTVFQHGELLPELTAIENVQIALDLGRCKQPSNMSLLRSKELLNNLGVTAQANTPARLLSGGERQKVAIARALVTRPQLILADEPTASLDGNTKMDVLQHLVSITQQNGAALVIVTHDQVVADSADSIFIVNPLNLSLRNRELKTND